MENLDYKDVVDYLKDKWKKGELGSADSYPSAFQYAIQTLKERYKNDPNSYEKAYKMFLESKQENQVNKK